MTVELEARWLAKAARDASLLVACEITEIGHQRGDVNRVWTVLGNQGGMAKRLYPKDFESEGSGFRREEEAGCRADIYATGIWISNVRKIWM